MLFFSFHLFDRGTDAVASLGGGIFGGRSRFSSLSRLNRFVFEEVGGAQSLLIFMILSRIISASVVHGHRFPAIIYQLDTCVFFVLAFVIWRATRHQLISSRRDFLTGLQNRSGMKQVITRLTNHRHRYGSWVSVVAIDVDNFKSINDSFGHAAGDEVLKSISAVIRRSVRKGDTAVRTGGDEFVLILENASPRSCALVTKRIQRNVRSIAGNNHGCSVSIGAVSVWGRRFCFEACAAEVDKLLYSAKACGRDTIAIKSMGLPRFGEVGTLN
ncbi:MULTISPECIES: GGDEF domain-containing protein [unclassified Caballeronia]|uniref:GGDEF domain-containing protein n=1 Tax=unclassified Caballeronia TaxID=2646786 RepID=UPI002027C24B|nr:MULTISPECIES: GGDEF domain-containing protein [unclassified Caballeronia]